MLKKSLLSLIAIQFISLSAYSETNSADSTYNQEIGFPITLEELEEPFWRESEFIPEQIDYCEQAVNDLMSSLFSCEMDLNFPIEKYISSRSECIASTPPYDNTKTIDQHVKDEYQSILDDMKRANCVPEKIFLTRLAELHDCLVKLNSKRQSIKLICEMLYLEPKYSPTAKSSPSPVRTTIPLNFVPLNSRQVSPSPVPQMSPSPVSTRINR